MLPCANTVALGCTSACCHVLSRRRRYPGESTGSPQCPQGKLPATGSLPDYLFRRVKSVSDLTPGDRECTFQPRINNRSRQMMEIHPNRPDDFLGECVPPCRPHRYRYLNASICSLSPTPPGAWSPSYSPQLLKSGPHTGEIFSYVRPFDPAERLEQIKEKKQRKQDRLQQQHEDQECTFRPGISNGSVKLMASSARLSQHLGEVRGRAFCVRARCASICRALDHRFPTRR